MMVSRVKSQVSLSPLFFLCTWALACSLLIGGGGANIYLTNPILQIVTLPTLLVAVWRLCERGPPAAARPMLYLIGACVLLIVIQIIPVPPSLWLSLPFRDKVLVAYVALGEPNKWAPLSLNPEATIVGALTSLPPLSLFLGAISLGLRERRLLTVVALAFGIINAFLGLLQLSQGPENAHYFYKYSGVGDSIGLFANRNHEAALLYSLIPLAAAWIGALAPTLTIRNRSRKTDTTAVIKMSTVGVTTFILIVAALMTRSRTGVILLICALAGSIFLQPWQRLGQSKSRFSGIFVVIAVCAVMLGMQYGLYRIFARFETDLFADMRVGIMRNTAKAALKAFPFGTGLGSFAAVYASSEKPTDLQKDVFINLAHNDPLQIILEMGVLGVGFILSFFAWFALRCRESWRVNTLKEPIIDFLLPRAATLSIGLLLAHSLVEFPLRTNALLGFFAICCALLVPPPIDSDQRGQGD